MQFGVLTMGIGIVYLNIYKKFTLGGQPWETLGSGSEEDFF